MKRGGSLSFLIGTIRNVLVMEIGWTDVGSGGTHSNASYFCIVMFFFSDIHYIGHNQSETVA